LPGIVRVSCIFSVQGEIIDTKESKKAKKDIDKIYKKLGCLKEKGSIRSSTGSGSESGAGKKTEPPPRKDIAGSSE
jgi:hypothetical protein